jgi:hypothetical protein
MTNLARFFLSSGLADLTAGVWRRAFGRAQMQASLTRFMVNKL